MFQFYVVIPDISKINGTRKWSIKYFCLVSYSIWPVIDKIKCIKNNVLYQLSIQAFHLFLQWENDMSQCFNFLLLQWNTWDKTCEGNSIILPHHFRHKSVLLLWAPWGSRIPWEGHVRESRRKIRVKMGPQPHNYFLRYTLNDSVIVLSSWLVWGMPQTSDRQHWMGLGDICKDDWHVVE